MPLARNPDTGETVYLDDSGAWKPAQRARNPESGEELAFDGKAWTSLGLPPMQGPKQPPIGAGPAFLRSAADAAAFNLRDEAAGLVAAGGGDPRSVDFFNPDRPLDAFTIPGRLRPFAHMAVGAARRAFGSPEAEQAYVNEVERQRAEAKRAEAEQPGASLAGTVTGAVATPIGAVRAANLGGRALQAAGIGAGTGALSGFGEGEETFADRFNKALLGGAIGGVAGGVGAPLAEGAVAAGRYLARKPIELVRSAIAPGSQAERAIGRAYAEAAAADPAAVNRLALGTLGPDSPAVVMDVLGVPGQKLARSAANLSGEAESVLKGTLEPRAQGQSLRFTDMFRNWMHHPDAFSAQEAIDLAERTGNRANYGAAMKAGDFPIRSDTLERLADAAPVQRAMKAAAEAQQTRAVIEGYGGFRSPVTITADGQVRFNRNAATGVPVYPNLAFWDATRKQISDAARQAGRAGRNEEASVLGDLARTINRELDTMVPSYATARQGAAAYFGEENALKAGAKFVNSDFNIPQTRAVLAKMNASERQLFEDGFASHMIDELNRHERVMNRPQMVQRLFASPAAKERIKLVLGEPRAKELEAMLRTESIMQQAGPAVGGNSTTVRQLIGMGLAGATGGYATGWDPTTSLGSALVVYGKGKLDQRVAARVANMLISSDPKVVDRGVKMIANNERFMSVLREINAAQARAAGEQAGRRAP